MNEWQWERLYERTPMPLVPLLWVLVLAGCLLAATVPFLLVGLAINLV